MKFKTIICLCILTVLLCGCSSSDEDYVFPEDVAQSQSEAIIEHVKNKDAEALKEMFCNETKNTHDLDAEIDAFLNSIEGEIISHDEPRGSLGMGKTTEEDGLVVQLLKGRVDNVKTDKGKVYTIGFNSYYTYAANPDYVGVCYIRIADMDMRDENYEYPEEAIVRIGGAVTK